MPLAVALLTTALVTFAVNFVAATGGHCGDDGCTGFPEWLYVTSGWAVMASLAALLFLLMRGLAIRITGRR
jgi:hypothetical protein